MHDGGHGATRRPITQHKRLLTMTAVKRIVLTGASGFVGQHVLSRLMQTPSLKIHAICRDINGFSEAVAAAPCDETTTVIVTSLDLTNGDAVDQWISDHPKLDLCLHLAAMSNPRACEEVPEQAMSCNNPESWFQALSSRGIPIVALSTDQVYDGTKGTLYIESDLANPVNIYGKSKETMEKTLARKQDCKSVSLRSSIVLGPLAPFGNAHSTFLHFCETRSKQETDFYTDECRTVVSVDDVADVLMYFCSHGVALSDIYNMGGRDRVSRYDMAAAVFQHFGYDTKYLVAKEKATLPPGPVASPLDISMDSSKLAKLTGVNFKGLDEIIQDTFPSKAS